MEIYRYDTTPVWHCLNRNGSINDSLLRSGERIVSLDRNEEYQAKPETRVAELARTVGRDVDAAMDFIPIQSIVSVWQLVEPAIVGLAILSIEMMLRSALTVGVSGYQRFKAVLRRLIVELYRPYEGRFRV